MGKGTSTQKAGGGGGGSTNASNKASTIKKEIKKLEAERKDLVNKFSKAEDKNNESEMNKLRNLIAANDRERRNAEKRLRYALYGEA